MLLGSAAWTHRSPPTHTLDIRCQKNGIEHRLTTVKHPWMHGQVERMNRTTEEATVNRFHYEDHRWFEMHLANFIGARDLVHHLESLRGLTPLRVHP